VKKLTRGAVGAVLVLSAMFGGIAAPAQATTVKPTVGRTMTTFGPYGDIGLCLAHAANLVAAGWYLPEICSPGVKGWYSKGIRRQ
jgi:hypothetical protein